MKKLLHLLLMLTLAIGAYAQHPAKGKVIDARTGEPLIGASVLLKSNPSVGTTTDIEGAFTLLLPSANETMVVNYIGYLTQELPAMDGMIVKLIESSEVLDEVVVIGYGTQRKGDVTSSVASVKSENFVKGAVKDIGQLMQGKVAGLAITNPSGDPLGNTQIRLRGTKYNWWC